MQRQEAILAAMQNGIETVCKMQTSSSYNLEVALPDVAMHAFSGKRGCLRPDD